MTGNTGPVSPEGRPMDLIEVEGLRLRCVIGCTAEERRGRSDVVIDMTIGTDAMPAAASDNLADALDYRAAAKAVIAAVEGSEYFTVEALITQIARIVVCDQRAPWVRVRVRKPGALRFADTVGLVLERTQADFAAAGSPS
jgi:FolB domain-containing protein